MEKFKIVKPKKSNNKQIETIVLRCPAVVEIIDTEKNYILFDVMLNQTNEIIEQIRYHTLSLKKIITTLKEGSAVMIITKIREGKPIKISFKNKPEHIKEATGAFEALRVK